MSWLRILLVFLVATILGAATFAFLSVFFPNVNVVLDVWAACAVTVVVFVVHDSFENAKALEREAVATINAAKALKSMERVLRECEAENQQVQERARAAIYTANWGHHASTSQPTLFDSESNEGSQVRNGSGVGLND